MLRSLLSACLLLAASAAVAEPPTFRLIGEQTLPKDMMVEGTPVGGLSGLACPETGVRCYALSDDRSERAPARLYEVVFDYDEGSLRSVAVTRVVTLRDRDGNAFPARSVDPEGLAPAPGGDLVWSSEGGARERIAPFVAVMARDGRLLRTLPLPERFGPDGSGRRGVRDNLAFEGLTMMPDGRRIAVATENALAQDGPIASPGEGSRSRITLYDLASGAVQAEYAYDVEPIPARAPIPLQTGDNGISEILALSDEALLVMERSYVPGVGNTIRLFRAEFLGATDVSGRQALAGAADIVPLRKSLVLDLGTLGIRLDNFEAMAWGKPLANGSRSLILASDDNFNPGQVTKFVILEVGGLSQL